MDAIQKEIFDSWMEDGRFELAMRNGWGAEFAFDNALKIDPQSKEAAEGLDQAQKILGKDKVTAMDEKKPRIAGLDRYFTG